MEEPVDLEEWSEKKNDGERMRDVGIQSRMEQMLRSAFGNDYWAEICVWYN